ncbi:hypothetical protein ACU8KH_02714 [Lachancea thermotolerans]
MLVTCEGDHQPAGARDKDAGHIRTVTTSLISMAFNGDFSLSWKCNNCKYLSNTNFTSAKIG